MQESGFRIWFLETGYFFSKILSEFRKKIVAQQERTGYADSRYFSVCYKKYWHITPTDYRRTLQESG